MVYPQNSLFCGISYFILCYHRCYLSYFSYLHIFGNEVMFVYHTFEMGEEDHKGFCIKSLHSSNQILEIPGSDDFDFAEALESVYPILEIIFNYLNYRDLKSCCSVKKSWEVIAENVLKKRKSPSWFTCYRTAGKKKSNLFQYSKELNYNNVGIGIVLYDSRRIKLSKFICLHKNTTELMRKSVVEYLEEEIISPDVEYCVLSCPRVVSYFDPKSEAFNDVVRSSIMDGLFIPKIENIRTAMFHCNAVKKEDIENSIRPFIRQNEEVKCLLLFSTKDLSKSLLNILKYLIPENDPTSVPVGGGIIRGTKLFQQHLARTKRVFTGNDIFCITFLKDKYMNADFSSYSFVIHGDDLSREEFEEELKKIRLQIILRTYNVAIRICCAAKIEFEDESSMFNNVFPNIPLIGFHANGEIGWNSFGQSDMDNGETKAKRSKQKYPTVQHQWSTVFVIISWGPIKV